jgi:hopanoid biosynthesis associated RND transporter like protein HpnN
MLRTIITRTVALCTRFPWTVVAISCVLAFVSTVYAVRNFAITTDINQLISPHLSWRQRELAFEKAFPDRYQTILIVVQAPTVELVSQASATLAQSLARRPELFRAVNPAGGGEFFRKNGLLYLPTEDVERTASRLTEGAPLVNALAADPSIRGLIQGLSFSLLGVQGGRISLDDIARPYGTVADTLENVLAGRPATFSWNDLLKGRPSEPSELRRFIAVRPVMNFAALEPGRAATDAIRQTAKDLRLAEEYGATVRLTGPVPIADEEFSTVKEGAVLNNILTVLVVLGILWMALRSAKIIGAVFVTLAVGFCIAAAVGLMLVHALNLISIAFAVLFVGLGVDFGLQFSVRYRAERHYVDDLPQALANAGAKSGAPLTLAAAAVTAGFLSFLPTPYRGVSELGQIAGAGMIIAFITSVTLLPALLAIFKPPGEAEPMGFKWLAPVDRFMEKHRIGIVALTLLIALGGAPLLFYLKFDFNPINLRNPKVESVATFLELRNDPAINANSISLLEPSLEEAQKVADRLAKLPEASRVMTLAGFVPNDQTRKLAALNKANTALSRGLNPANQVRPPTEEQNRAALRTGAQRIGVIVGERTGKGADVAKRLADDLNKLADADAAVLQRADTVFVRPLKVAIDDLRDALGAQQITLETLPKYLINEWTTADGRARIDVLPKGDPNDNENLRRFAAAVQTAAPEATGGPISILESGRTIVLAFIQAGLWAMISITILLWITLRRFGDVLLTLVPLLLAGVITLEACVLLEMQLNFANIIALPLLLGVGVAFKIYYVMAWRGGQTSLLQSTLTRAVVFSAATTATAFGSLWLSSHPGTSSMGKLMALSLACTMLAAVLFQPALMGRPRQHREF